jgi:outer membrane protein
MAFLCNCQKKTVNSSVPSSNSARGSRIFQQLQATAAVACLLVGTAPSYAMGQQDSTTQKQQPSSYTTAGLPAEPAPNLTQPLYMRSTARDFSKPRGYFPRPFAPYAPTTAPDVQTNNSPKLDQLVKNGKIYLSLSDAVILALENNYDIAIQRYNLDIADTDLLRAKAGSTLNGVSTGLVTGTLGGSTLLSMPTGVGGTSTGSGGAGTGAGGLVITTSGAGPLPEQLDPVLTGNVQYEATSSPQTTSVFTGTNTLTTDTGTYNFGYNQGFLTGTQLAVTFDNTRQTTNNITSTFSPILQSNFRAEVTQHLLQGFGPGINGRFILQAKNTRRITDSAFRAQLLFTINQIENIYWGLVASYEDVQSKTNALTQSKQLASDNRKQLQIGTMAPLDVVNSDSAVASDQQALISSQTTLEYQQLVMKQAIARNLNDPALTNAAVIPTDRVSLLETPEERANVDDLVRQADVNSPTIEQAILNLKNDEISLRGAKNALLPTIDAYAFYGSSALGGAQNPKCENFFTGQACPPGQNPPVGFPTVLQNLFNNSTPDKGVGVNITIPIRNRVAQAEQTRSVIEFRQAQMRLAQLYVQIKYQVIESQFALTNDRAQVQAALAAREYAFQSLDAEQKKYRLGASTTALVLQQQRNLAGAENTVISDTTKYATDRASFAQTLASTLDRYGISLSDAVAGTVAQAPVIPGIEPAKQLPDALLPSQQQNLLQEEQQAIPEPQNEPKVQPLQQPNTTPPPAPQPPPQK